MDLRAYGLNKRQIEEFTHLACRGLMCYQPFVISDALQTGAGYEFAKVAEGAGLVYCAERPAEYAGNASVDRLLIDPEIRGDFADYNQRLRVLYDSMIDMVGEKLGPISGLTVADVGCCSGYFPLSFAQRGAKRAVGYDLVDYAPTFSLLNEILGTRAEFVHSGYIGANGGITDADSFDVVFSIAVLVHLSDPLQHLAFLGRMARRALVVWTWTSENEEDQMVIRYGSVNRYYEHARFPYCFDIMQISPGLLKRSLELMGFTEVHPIVNKPEGMPDYWFDRHRGYLAIRPNAFQDGEFTPEKYSDPRLFGLADSVPRLVQSFQSYNIVSLRGQFWGIPQALGPMDLTNANMEKLAGVIAGHSPEAVIAKIRSLR